MQILSGVLLVVLLMNSQNNCGVRADDKNLTRLLNNQVIVTKQIMCVLEKSPCDQLGRQLKGMSVGAHCIFFIFYIYCLSLLRWQNFINYL